MSSAHCLVLCPQDIHWSSTASDLEHALRGLGLIGPGLIGSVDERGWQTGAHFLQLLTYLGCSPHISLGEAEAATRIHVRLMDAPVLLAGSNLKPARCRHCRGLIGTASTTALSCPHCAQSLTLLDLDWRRSAAVGRVFIEITNIHESEAVPTDALLDGLARVTQTAWDYAYLRDAVISPSSS